MRIILRQLCFVILLISSDLSSILGNMISNSSDTGNFSGEMAATAPIYLNEEKVVDLLEGQWLALINAMHRAFLAVAAKNTVQPPRTSTTVNDTGVLMSMPGYVDLKTLDGEDGENVLTCKLVTQFPENSQRNPPMPAILATILMFDSATGKLNYIIDATEITARRTAAASVAATNILYKNRHSKTTEDPFILCILGAGVQGKNHAIAFNAAYPNISEIRIWNRGRSKAERLVDELKSLGIHQAVLASTERQCAEGADVLVTATRASQPILHGGWVKKGAHINAVGSGETHYSELDLPLYRRAKIYLADEDTGRSELQGLESLGIPLIGTVGDIVLKPHLMPNQEAVTVFQSCGMAAEDALAAQLVYKRHLQAQKINN